MFKLENLTKTFVIDNNPSNDRHALKGINLTINDGDFITVIGGNGSGKTTLLNMIAGAYPATNGSIFINKKNITKTSEHKRARYIGRVFQDPMVGTVGEMSIEENFSLAFRRGKVPSLAWGLKRQNRAKFVAEIGRLNLGLENRLFSKVGLLSGGQRQALTLLMATLHRPEILLLDEHTAALDPKTAKTVLELTNNLVTESSLTTLMITHNMKDAIKYGNRLIMMSEGKIIFDVKGEEKQNLTVNQLIAKFSDAGDDELPDNMLLS